MTKPVPLPYRQPLFGAAEMSAITGVNRNTSQGWFARYDMESIGIVPMPQGTGRQFTMEQIGVLSIVRVATSVRQAEAAFEALPEIAEHAEQIYEAVASNISWQSWGSDVDDRRPYLPMPASPAHLEGRHYFGDTFTFHVTDRPYLSRGEDLRDLLGYPTPVLLLPLDAALRNAWNRATFLKYGFALED